MYCKYMHGITCSAGKAGGSPIPKKEKKNNNTTTATEFSNFSLNT